VKPVLILSKVEPNVIVPIPMGVGPNKNASKQYFNSKKKAVNWIADY